MRTEFKKSVKLEAYKRCLVDNKPHCELCGKKILGVPEFDHIKADGLGGEATIENCQVLCGSCHRQKTHEQDRPIMTKADAQFEAQIGVKRKYRWAKRSFAQ
jgi:5-methylcytosine-specific restriction endonuclease McrA